MIVLGVVLLVLALLIPALHVLLWVGIVLVIISSVDRSNRRKQSRRKKLVLTK